MKIIDAVYIVPAACFATSFLNEPPYMEGVFEYVNPQVLGDGESNNVFVECAVGAPTVDILNHALVTTRVGRNIFKGMKLFVK